MTSVSRSGPAESLEDCFWHVGRPARPARPALDGETTADVAIIGAGYTGLSAAYHLKRAESGLDVVVLEAESIGFGASGRNGGFVMTLFGASLPLMKALHGGTRVREAHEYMEGAIAGLEETIREHTLDCDFERRGFLKVATAPAYRARIESEVELLRSLGIGGVEWIDRAAVESRIAGRGYLGAWWEPGGASLNPLKWLDGLASLAESRGTRLYEGTRVLGIRRRGGQFELTTRKGRVKARKIVFATNAYSHLVPGMRYKQMPAFTYVIVTDPLDRAERAALRWSGREAVEDGRNFMHYYRLTPDDRILAGGGPGIVPFADRMGYDAYPKAWDHLERFILRTFPQLGGIRVAHRWGGAFSMTPDFTPQIGTLHSGDAVFSIGCTGHGVAMTHMNGQVIRDLILERKTPLTRLWFVNRRTIPMPPEPIRTLVAACVSRAMAIDDWWCERGSRDGS